ncbi:hypothetical protein X975_20006, partial [Stegodyphus mimosarum]
MEEQLRQFMAAFAALKEEIKAGQDSVKEDMKSIKEDMKVGQESFKQEMKAGQESVKEEMKAGQASVKEEMKAVKAEMKVGQEEIKREITCIIENKFEGIENRIDTVENRVGEIEERVSAVQHQIEQQIEDKVSAVAKEVDTLKKFVATAGSNSDTFKFLAMPAHPSLKLSTYDGKTSWQVYKTQFSIVAEANGWDSQAKACHLAASLRADAADILQTLPENKRLDFEALSDALELRFGEKCLKDYSRLQLKSRQQKPMETLQELATDVERLSPLAFSECPTETREILSLQYFIDGIRDPEIQQALRMADVKDIKSALVYAMKFEVAQQATRKGHHPLRAVRVHEPVDQLIARLDDLTRQVNALQRNIGDKKPTVKCWNCVCGKSNGLSINGHIDGVPCSMIIDTGANVTIIRKDLAQKFKDKLIWTPSCVTLETASGEKIDVEGKLNVNITFGSATYHHTAYVADITDPCILGLDFLRKYNFSLDFKNKKLLSASQDITIDQQKGSSAGNAKVSFERPCSESYRNHTRVEEKRKTTSNSPSQTLIGGDLRLPSDFLSDRLADAPSSPKEYIQDVQARFEVKHRSARKRVNLATKKMKTRYDTRATGHRFNEGDNVWLWSPTRRNRLSPKLQSPWDGPYTVLNRLNDVVVRIRKSSNSKPKVVHYDRLVHYYGHST